jgi:hypothetical protein
MSAKVFPGLYGRVTACQVIKNGVTCTKLLRLALTAGWGADDGAEGAGAGAEGSDSPNRSRMSMA